VPSNETFDFRGPAGRLEAILMLPEAPPVAAAVVCHAHPLHGGMMHSKVVFRAAKALQSAGLAVLRFNFRGVGRSEGVHDHGTGEQEDARAALFEVQDRFPGVPLVLGGFSFGSLVALHVAARDPRVRAVFALGYPLRMAEDHSSLASIDRPHLFVQGEHDELGPGEALRALVEPLPPPRELVVLPGADHFFDGRLDALQGAIADWAEGRPWALPDESQSRRPRVEEGVSSGSSSSAEPEPPPRGR
jgi:alpha/beta superfamily hydrolase